MACYGEKPPDFLALQPNGQIPVAVIDGAVLRWDRDREMGSWIAGAFEIEVDLQGLEVELHMATGPQMPLSIVPRHGLNGGHTWQFFQ